MAYTKTLADATTYFDTTVRYLDWSNYNDTEKTAALADAQRFLQTHLCRLMVDPEDEDQLYRDDYAVFEQAYYLLENTIRTQNNTNSAEMIETEDSKTRDKLRGISICPDARVYLMVNQIRVNMG